MPDVTALRRRQQVLLAEQRAEQRKAAAAGLRAFTAIVDEFQGLDDRANGERAGYIQALRDVGILAPGESAATLLAPAPAPRPAPVEQVVKAKLTRDEVTK